MTQSLNKPTNEKILPSFFIYPLLPLRVCVHTCVCVCSPCPNVLCNLCLFSAIFWKVVFLPLPYSPASWMAACAVLSGPQVTVLCTNPQNCVELLSSRDKRAQSPLPCPSSSIPAAWSSGMAWGLALSSSGHSYIPLILRGLQHLGLRKWVIVWPCKNTDFFFFCTVVLQMYLIKCPSPHTLNQHSPFCSAHKWWNANGKGGKGKKKKREGCNFLWGKQASSLFNKFIWDFPPKELRRGEPAVIKMS